MSNVNRSSYKTEVKSKIGDYIRGKISAHTLMHPSRINTKPIDRQRYNLNAGFKYEPAKTDYQRKVRRPPLKDYIEGKVKLSDMISPSKITFIPKERKYQTEFKHVIPEYDENDLFDKKPRVSFEESVKLFAHYTSPECSKSTRELRITNFRNAPNLKSEYTLVPIKSSAHGCGRKRKLMCKIKVQQQGSALTNGETAVEEHVIEIPEQVLRTGHGLPKFLLDQYNIPCYVNTAAKQTTKLKRPLAILDDGEDDNMTSKEQQTSIAKKKFNEAIEYPDSEGENAILVEVKEEPKNATNDVENMPSEQGDHNNTTTYVFEFYEEEVPRDSKSAIIEEIEDDTSNKDYGWSNMEDIHGGRRLYETPRSDKYRHYDDFKSHMHVQRELVDLHRGVLKCDTKVLVVERSVNQLTATLNMLEDIQNQEIKPLVTNMKRTNDKMQSQIQSLQYENDDLKKTVKYLRKKTIDYDKLIYLLKQSSHMKIQELENKLETITLAQMKSIEMQNVVNKNIFKMTNDIKRSYSELDSKHCCNSIKSPKNSNLT